MTLIERILVDNALAVLIDAATGKVLAVQDPVTGLAAELMGWGEGHIAHAKLAALNAWQSTIDF